MPTHTPKRSEYWRRLEAEARLFAISITEPESKRMLMLVAAGYRRLAERAVAGEAKRIHGASFGPEALKVICEAFDRAWAQIAGNFSDDSNYVEVVRRNLATAVLSVAWEECRDAQVLKIAALQRMALDYWK